jgi:membrane fusion protein (multidrug efflux system)
MNALPPGRMMPDAPPRGAASGATSPRKRLTGRRIALAAVCAACLPAAGYFGFDWWRHGRFIETTDDAYVGGDVIAISPHVAGFVTDILVADNAHVRASQLLARIDMRDYQAAYDRAAATVAAETASLQGLQAQRVVQLASIRQSAAELSAKSARAEFTTLDGARYATLSVTRAASLQDAERARTVDREAQSAMVASQAGLAASRAQIDVLDAQIRQAEAAIAQGEADLRRARLDLGYTEIRSPADGFVANRAVRPGTFVAAGTYLLSVVPADGLWVDANFKEDQLGEVAPGQAATLVADAAPGKLFHGRVLSLAPGTGAVFAVIPPENATGNFTKIVQRVPVRIGLDPSDATLGRLRPGLSVTVSVDTRQAP